ncbi:MAG: 3-dehydroquinate synthase [Nocardioides sp.]
MSSIDQSVTTIAVNGPQPYEVLVGRGLLGSVPSWIAEVPRPPQRVALVYDEALAGPETAGARLRALRAGLEEHFTVCDLPLPSGESAKSVTAVSAAWERLGAAGFTRSDWVVTCGGGAVTDVGGFIAATWLRGVPVVHVPSTVLAMVDAAVGGKTGMNTAAGKNLVGAFHEPSRVFCDLDLLTSLPEPELSSGMAEAIKAGFIADPEILELAAGLGPLSVAVDTSAFREIVERAIAVKATVVAADLKESGGEGRHPGREALNYGHTLAHAIERAEDYRTRHGEAVAIGCVFVAEVAHRSGLIDRALLDRHRQAFAAMGLPTTYSGSDWATLRATMSVDKKSRGSSLRLVILHGLADPRILADPAESLLEEAAMAIGVRR